MNITTDTPIGEVVKINYKTATTFQSNNIDFCCGGNRTIGEACEEAGVQSDLLIGQLNDAMQESDPDADYINSLELSALADYIVNRHHAYIRKNIPFLKENIDKIARVHGGNHPELAKVKDEFYISAGELVMHMQKEELMLFPYIKRMEHAKKENRSLPSAPFGEVSNSIEVMVAEHQDEGDRFEKISKLTDNYTVPSDGCSTYDVTFRQLAEFEKDLHRHIHLENNILFPKAQELEDSFHA